MGFELDTEGYDLRKFADAYLHLCMSGGRVEDFHALAEKYRLFEIIGLGMDGWLSCLMKSGLSSDQALWVLDADNKVDLIANEES